ncbi:TlpA family protein disulfide reductase [Aporhodopirellula aestuarii]|uniref:TlpA family protein disulfide reductase n=1 Tax=Aporhodopirellula aestuarii TaxID=2950107 RepID=A0ABT0U4Y1_9BACT|nr:TlpA disulfide reductase family protein [Aporhodopirellula aestuarii]MCM2371953.1 TlpA family protein disulfide reductase [Aporhodopirellula aestuarii]
MFCLVIYVSTTVHAQSTPPLGLLRLVGGDYLPGTLANSSRDSGQSHQLAWQYPHFAAPVSFDLKSVVTASFPPPIPFKPEAGEFVIDLVQGDQLFGTILGVDEWSVHASLPAFGEITLMRSAVRRISQWRDGESMLFVGPGPINDWIVDGERDDWQSGGGQIRTERANASAYRDIGLSNVVQLNAELSWEGNPNFVFAIGVDKDNSDESAASAYRVEVWDDQVVLVRELAEVADVIQLGAHKDLGGHLSLLLQIHQNDGHVVALSPQGGRLGEFELPANDYPDVRPGIRLTNLNGSVSLDSLHVRQLSDIPAQQTVPDHDVLVLEDHTILSGKLIGVHDGLWGFRADDTVYQIATKQISSFEVAQQTGTVPSEPNVAVEQTPATGEDDRTQLQVVSHGGIRLTGAIHSIADGRLVLRCDAIAEELEFDNEQIGRLTVSNSTRASRGTSPFILGRMEVPGGRFKGRFVDTEEQATPTPLRFALYAADPVNLRPSFTGRMVYRETPPPETQQQRQIREKREALARRNAQRQAQQGGVWNVLTRAFGNNAANNVKPVTPRSMHLRSGEIIPCVVGSIDESEIRFVSDVTGKTRLPADQVRAIQFVADCRDPEIEVARRDRLLTLPRIRKKNRPTHLVVAVNGDILRCRLLRLDDDSLVVETRLEEIEIDRSVLAQIIWLNDAEEVDAQDDPESDKESTELSVRAILRNGNRMSMIARGLDKSILSGEHPLLGESRIKLGDVNELLIGIDIDQPDENQPYGSWQLKDAPEPIIPESGGEGGSGAGTHSALVGKQAPDFTLDLLEGGQFSISGQRGKVTVLDFWATWCGPCLQAMPLIEETVSEFDENDVRLVAVNLQETAEPIRDTLERLKIAPEVALDIDGVAAARYQADAIPQTVVIGRDGTITHVFVGGGPSLAGNLREAITKTLADANSD